MPFSVEGDSALAIRHDFVQPPDNVMSRDDRTVVVIPSQDIHFLLEAANFNIGCVIFGFVARAAAQTLPEALA